MYGEIATVLSTQPSADFVETPYIKNLTNRALDYIGVGFPVNLSGPAGVGKTTLALHIAAQLGRPAVIVCGDHEFGSSDLVGGLLGYHKKSLKDNYIRSVLKTDESMTSQWVDNRLTTACQHGLTLIYDEFTRSRPEANNVLLSILAEGLLPLPASRGGENYLKVHPDFTAIFTSNPEEYAGVYKSQDALRDRMVTIELGNFDEETEVAITRAKTKLASRDSRHIVRLVRKVREAKSENKLTPTVRACIVLGKILKLKGDTALDTSNGFKRICLDVLMSEVAGKDRKKVSQVIDEALSTSFHAETNYD
ncbi:MAG: gas vesicle protein GvpN [Chloroflexi bacterium RBG_16_51_9]|nr:MAG: gas vesicle protein GvpN [Chloroflexi bacterium RBG_16_51_9]